MVNQVMEQKLACGEALDVRKVGTQLGPGLFELKEFKPGFVYCDSAREVWMWSIGRERSSGRILAATDPRFYLDPAFECLWVR